MKTYEIRVELKESIVSDLYDDYQDNDYWTFDSEDHAVIFTYTSDDITFDRDILKENKDDFYYEMNRLIKMGEKIIYQIKSEEK